MVGAEEGDDVEAYDEIDDVDEGSEADDSRFIRPVGHDASSAAAHLPYLSSNQMPIISSPSSESFRGGGGGGNSVGVGGVASGLQSQNGFDIYSMSFREKMKGIGDELRWRMDVIGGGGGVGGVEAGDPAMRLMTASTKTIVNGIIGDGVEGEFFDPQTPSDAGGVPHSGSSSNCSLCSCETASTNHLGDAGGGGGGGEEDDVGGGGNSGQFLG